MLNTLKASFHRWLVVLVVVLLEDHARLEALAMQTAVVATPLSCDGIAVTHGRDVVFALRSDEFVSQIVRLLKDPIARTRLALNGRRLIERLYTWRRVADAYEHLYHAVIREHSDD